MVYVSEKLKVMLESSVLILYKDYHICSTDLTFTKVGRTAHAVSLLLRLKSFNSGKSLY